MRNVFLVLVKEHGWVMNCVFLFSEGIRKTMLSQKSMCSI
jgi:hypothetical protein